MDAEKYRQVLIQYAVPSGKRLIGDGLELFQYHSVLIQSTLIMPVKSYLERKTADKTLTVLNIIEAACDHLDREINIWQPKWKGELWEVLKEA